MTALFAIHDTMQYVAPDVVTICVGQAASAAAVLLAAGAPGKRYALPNARVLIHQPHGGAQGQRTDLEIAGRRDGRDAPSGWSTSSSRRPARPASGSSPTSTATTSCAATRPSSTAWSIDIIERQALANPLIAAVA